MIKVRPEVNAEIIISIAETAKLFNVSYTTIGRMERKGLIARSRQVGRTPLFSGKAITDCWNSIAHDFCGRYEKSLKQQ